MAVIYDKKKALEKALSKERKALVRQTAMVNETKAFIETLEGMLKEV